MLQPAPQLHRDAIIVAGDTLVRVHSGLDSDLTASESAAAAFAVRVGDGISLGGAREFPYGKFPRVCSALRAA